MSQTDIIGFCLLFALVAAAWLFWAIATINKGEDE